MRQNYIATSQKDRQEIAEAVKKQRREMAFKLGDEEGFRWVGAYEISADDLLDGKEGKPQFSGESPFSPTVELE